MIDIDLNPRLLTGPKEDNIMTVIDLYPRLLTALKEDIMIVTGLYHRLLTSPT